MGQWAGSLAEEVCRTAVATQRLTHCHHGQPSSCAWAGEPASPGLGGLLACQTCAWKWVLTLGACGLVTPLLAGTLACRQQTLAREWSA